MAVLVPLTVLEAAIRPGLPWRTVWGVLLVVLIPALLWRRSRPLLVFAVAFGLTGLAPILTGPPKAYAQAYLLILLYALYRWGSGREIVIGTAILLAKAGISLAAGGLGTADAIAGIAVLSAVTSLGATFRYRAGAGSACSNR